MKYKWQNFLWISAMSILKHDWNSATAFLQVSVQLAAKKMCSYVLDDIIRISEEFGDLQSKGFLIHESPSGQWTSHPNFEIAMDSNTSLRFLQLKPLKLFRSKIFDISYSSTHVLKD